jgi:hypothetical protein
MFDREEVRFLTGFRMFDSQEGTALKWWVCTSYMYRWGLYIVQEPGVTTWVLSCGINIVLT